MADAEVPMQVMRCRVCDALLKAENLDFRQGIASCSYCDAVMRFETDEPSSDVQMRPDVELPARFTVEDVEDVGDEFRIAWRWFTAKALFLVVFTVFWCGFLVFWYAIGLSSGAPLMMFVFPLLHVAVGVGLAYLCVCMFVNRTTVSVSRGRLNVVHKPLPWPGGGSYESGDIKQFYCEHKVHHGKNSTTHRYSVHAVKEDGSRKELVKGLDEPHKALFVEQQLEKHLGLADEAVTGELPR